MNCRILPKLAVCLVVLALAACGGGGGGNTGVTGSTVSTTYTVGGTVSGLPGGASLVVQDNGADSLTITVNGSFKFATGLANNAAYAVTVLTQPIGANCTISGGSDSIASASVTTIAISCVGGPAASAKAIWTYSQASLSFTPTGTPDIRGYGLPGGSSPFWLVTERDVSGFHTQTTTLTTTDYAHFTSAQTTVDGSPVNTQTTCGATTSYTTAPDNIVTFGSILLGASSANLCPEVMTSTDGTAWTSLPIVSTTSATYAFSAAQCQASNASNLICVTDPMIAATSTPPGLTVGGPSAALFIKARGLSINAGDPELLRSYGPGFGGSGLTWTSVALPSSCQAVDNMVAHDSVLLLWDSATNVVCVSGDDGQTWKTQTPTISLGSATYSDMYSLNLGAPLSAANGEFIGDTGYSDRDFFLKSTDGLSWGSASTPIASCTGYTQSNFSIAFATTKWIYLDYLCRGTAPGPGAYALASSTDGLNWIYVAQPSASSTNFMPVVMLAPSVNGSGNSGTFTATSGSIVYNFWVIPNTDNVVLQGAWYDAAGHPQVGLVQANF